MVSVRISNKRPNRATAKTAGPRIRPAAVAIASAVCWMDLHKYGGDLEQAGFDPTHPNAARPISRLRAFHEIVAKHSGPSFPSLAMNDGAAAYCDLGLAPNETLFKFIVGCWKLYCEATATDIAIGGSGLRGVIGLGLRAKGSARGMKAQDDAFASIIEDISAQRIDRAEAIKRARRIRRDFDIVPQLQANFAFARAYEAEAKAGLPAPNLYLDTLAFTSGAPDWIEVTGEYPWKARLPSLSTNFVALSEVREVPDDVALMTLRSGRELKALLQNRS